MVKTIKIVENEDVPTNEEKLKLKPFINDFTEWETCNNFYSLLYDCYGSFIKLIWC